MTPVDSGGRYYGSPVDDTAVSGIAVNTAVSGAGNSTAFSVQDDAELTATVTAAATGGTYAIQTLHLSSGTSGSTILNFTWQSVVYTTPSIALGATAAQVQAAVNAAVGASGQQLPPNAFTVSGGPFGTGDLTITAQNGMSGPITALGHTDTTLTSTFTQGTAGVAPSAQTLTIKLQHSEDGVNWFDVGSAFTAATQAAALQYAQQTYEVEGMGQLRWNYAVTGSPAFAVTITTTKKLTGNA